MTTAWQKAMRGRKQRAKFEVVSTRLVREGTYEIEVDLGGDGFVTARLYPDDALQTSRRLDEKQTAKVLKALQRVRTSTTLKGAKRGAGVIKCVKKKAELASFDKRSIRMLVRGQTRILIGCPKGHWQPRKQRCKVGTRAYETITPGRCKRGSGGKTVRR